MTDQPALDLSRISKRFDSASVLQDVSLQVRTGTVHALLGENGAGKTTLMRIAFGMIRPDSGTIRVHGREARLRSPADAIALGVGMVHQHFTLVPAMTIAENIALGGHGRLQPREAANRVREIAAQTGFALDPDAVIESLPVGAQQRVEIAKALAREARILVLDEPTAGLAPAEADDLLRWLRSFVRAGNAAVLITHKLREALSVADDVTVLRRGQVVHSGPAEAASAESLTTAMIGAELARSAIPASGADHSRHGSPVFRADRLTVRDAAGAVRVREATFTVHAGEIVGVVGVEGAGQRELLRTLAGRTNPASGVLERPSLVGFVPEDRHRDAVLLDRPLTENVALRDAGQRHGLISWDEMRSRTQRLMRAFDVRAMGPATRMRSLSGGNQQKLVLARETDAGHAPAIVAENPARGLDVRATAEVHARLRAARDEGAAVVVYSSDLDEVLSLSSRVLVAYGGTIRETPADRDVVGRAMLGLD